MAASQRPWQMLWVGPWQTLVVHGEFHSFVRKPWHYSLFTKVFLTSKFAPPSGMVPAARLGGCGAIENESGVSVV
jgi:hypothetical protein